MQVIQISCTIGTASTNSTGYEATDATSGTATITEENGEYKVSVSNEITLFKGVEVGDGVPNAEENYSFIANNIQ